MKPCSNAPVISFSNEAILVRTRPYCTPERLTGKSQTLKISGKRRWPTPINREGARRRFRESGRRAPFLWRKSGKRRFFPVKFLLDLNAVIALLRGQGTFLTHLKRHNPKDVGISEFSRIEGLCLEDWRS